MEERQTKKNHLSLFFLPFLIFLIFFFSFYIMRHPTRIEKTRRDRTTARIHGDSAMTYTGRNKRSARMTSGNASAHLPIIIRLSSVAVFSAPLTDNPAEPVEARQARPTPPQHTEEFPSCTPPQTSRLSPPKRRKCVLVFHFHLMK